MRAQAAAMVAGAVVVTLAGAGPAPALERSGFGLAVLVDGSERPEYGGRGKLYVEAIKGREYSLRITNPLGCRVAVALSVDGLNTIDARHTTPADARKWVLEPYQTVQLDGWQVSNQHARRFFFTGERDSYGAFLGKTDDLGVIEAVFFKERERPRPVLGFSDSERHQGPARAQAERERRAEGGNPAGAPPQSALGAAAEAKSAPADEYAATGIGDKTDHRVEQVHLDLEPTPASVLRLRYGFRDELVKLGLLPRPHHHHGELDRREHAQGFSGSYCPDPFRDEQ